MFHDATALTFLLTVPFPKILKSLSCAPYHLLLIALTRSAKQKHNRSARVREIDSQPDTAWEAHFIQSASQRRTVTQVVMLFDCT